MDKVSLFTSPTVEIQVLLDLYNKVQEVHKEHADDLCVFQIDEIFKVIGLPVPDRRVGSKVAMKKNCDRYIDIMCEEGHWKSYVELEKEIEELKGVIRYVQYYLENPCGTIQATEQALERIKKVTKDLSLQHVFENYVNTKIIGLEKKNQELDQENKKLQQEITEFEEMLEG